MRDFRCCCGQQVFFENTLCLNCKRELGFEPERGELMALRADSVGRLMSESGEAFRYCRNAVDYGACNWLLPFESHDPYCRSCRLNEVVPDLSKPGNVHDWAKLEAGKRHLIYTLLQLGLPVSGRAEKGEGGLRFAFLEDARFNAEVTESFIATGHASGLITLNLAEADDTYREHTRKQLGEYHRTVVGHFRHESGHYYYDVFVRHSNWQEEFRTLFGDPDIDYVEALNQHYRDGPPMDWPESYISAYAQAHPLEDWAETWAHYLHMRDTLETAYAFAVHPVAPQYQDLDQLVASWQQLTVALNALNRSMGLPDAYPFVLTNAVVAKLRLVHLVIAAAS